MTSDVVTMETSLSQQSLWLIDQADPGRPTYNVLGAVRMRGDLQPMALERALNLVVRRHEALRTVFDFDGIEPVQHILPELVVPMPVREVEPDDLDAAIQAEIERPFDLATGPLLRITLLRLSEQEHVCVLVVHHIVTDGWSSAILFHELAEGYEAFVAGREPELAELAVQYADYAVWQRETLQGEGLDRLVRYWAKQLEGSTPLLLPTDRVRPRVASSAGATHMFRIPATVMTRLDRLAREHSASLFMALLAAFHVLLSRYARVGDISIATPVAGRTRPEVANLIGFFVNTVVLRTDSSDDPPFTDLLERVRQTSVDAFTHQDLPYDKLVELLRPERHGGLGGPLAQVMLSFQSIPQGEWQAGGLGFEMMDVATGTAKFDLLLDVAPNGPDAYLGRLEYSCELFRPETVRRMSQHFTTLLTAAATNPGLRVSRLPLLSEHERDRQLGEWAKAESVPARHLHQIVSQRAREIPDAVAVIHGDQSLTYAEVDARADRLARCMNAQGATADATVAVLLDSSPDLVVTLLAVQKAGGAFMVLDPAHPAKRQQEALDVAAPVLVVTSRPELLPADGPPSLSAAAAIPGQPLEPLPDNDFRPDGLACHGHGFGPAGTPRTVLSTQLGLTTSAAALAEALGLGQGERLLTLAQPGSDTLVQEIFAGLASGAAVVLPDGPVPADTPDLWRLIGRTASTVFSVPLPNLRSWTHYDRQTIPSCVRALAFSGAPAPTVDELRPWQDWPGRLVHLLGVPEAAGVVSAHVVTFGEPDSDPAAAAAVGRPLRGTWLYVLDDWLEPVPVGVTGELCVGGNGVARGYLGKPGATAARFVPDPWNERAGSRLHRTGSRARLLPDGNLQMVELSVRTGTDAEPGKTVFLAPRTPIEEELALIWADLLGVDQVGVLDDFFRLGGNSLAAVRMAAEVRDAFGVQLSLRAYMTIEPTIEALAEWLFGQLTETYTDTDE